MGFDENIEMVRLAFYQVLISSGPFLGAALAIGLIIGIFSTFSILVNIRSKLKKIRVFVPLLIINIWAFYTNTWVAINGMGIPYGKQFHIFLAVLIIFNYSIFRKYTNLKETSDLIIK